MVLFHRILGAIPTPEGPTPLVVLHGLLGSSDNWQTLAGGWAEHRPVVLVDQRNHGRSPHHPSHVYPDMVVDLLDTLDHLGIQQADLLGHSMGGKTVLAFRRPTPRPCRKLIIADMAPTIRLTTPRSSTRWPRSTDAIRTATRGRRRPRHRHSRAGHSSVPSQGPAPGGAGPLRLALQPARPAAASGGHDGLLAPGTVDLPSLALYGTRSDYVTGRGLEALQRHFPQLEATGLEAGHWLHAEQPAAFAEQVEAFLA